MSGIDRRGSGRRRRAAAERQRRELWGCRRKIRYPTRAAAGAAIAGLLAASTDDGRRGGGPVSWYRCRWCGGYHVGHERGRAPQKAFVGAGDSGEPDEWAGEAERRRARAGARWRRGQQVGAEEEAGEA